MLGCHFSFTKGRVPCDNGAKQSRLGEIMQATATGYTPFDRAGDVLKFEANPLDAIFAPKNVAVIGATETQGSVGRTILWNLISNPFGGTVFPVNPKRPSILGIKSYPSIGAVPDRVDLAVLVTPASSVPGLIGECVAAGVPGGGCLSPRVRRGRAPP